MINSRLCTHGSCPMNKSVPAPISLWIRRKPTSMLLTRFVISWRGSSLIRTIEVREIILDTETTGLDPAQGHRIVEIGAIELINHIPSGRTFHAYINPDRDMPRDAEEVHGLTTEFLKSQPRFREIADDLLAFIGEAML